MDNFEQLYKVLGQQEGVSLEYKAILPPSRMIAQLISSFANTDGGYIVLGVSENSKGIEFQGISDEFHATPITHKAIDLLTPRPDVDYKYITHQDKKLFAIWVSKSKQPILIEGKKYIRLGSKTTIDSPPEKAIKIISYQRLELIKKQLINYNQKSTNSKSTFIEHYKSIINIFNDLGNLLYPVKPSEPTNSHEGKILTRILFSSCVDNFESYLSDILFEIYLAKPDTLKSDQPVMVKEVLNCTDLQDFINYFARQKISKLQKGSVKGFIKANDVISGLDVMNNACQTQIEEILQIRHLYSHRNGIVDDKFIKNVSGTHQLNTEHQLSIEEVCDKITYLAEISHNIDEAAIQKFSLSYLN